MLSKDYLQSHKTLPSKYIYDAIGDAFFVKIMATPEDYISNAEMDVF